MRVQLTSPDATHLGIDLPWDIPLAHWPDELMVRVPRGLSRNLVRFAMAGSSLLAIKEIPDPAALKEYKLLRQLEELHLPVVEPFAVITERGNGRKNLMGMIITRFLEFSLPYRILLSTKELAFKQEQLMDAMVDLIVQLHLAGFYWGDCSLSNTLFRRDAGRLAAYLVDAETGEMQPLLSGGMRRYDLEQAEENIAGELMDVAAERGLPEDMDPVVVAGEIVERYHRLWHELNRDEVIGIDETYRIQARIKRLHQLGFDVEEMELITTNGGHRLAMRPRVVEPGFHKRRLHALTGLVAQENQSRQLLNDIFRFKAGIESQTHQSIPQSLAALRWITELYQPAIHPLIEELRGVLDGPELYHQILEHRWFMSEAAFRDVGTEEAIQSYRETILPKILTETITHFAEDGEEVKAKS